MTYLTFICKDGTVITLNPSGQRCDYCPLVDTNWDPVGIMRDRLKRPCRWGRPPKPNGENDPGPCYYCMKYYKSRIYLSRVPHVTESEYRVSLGQDEQKLKMHCACSIQIILVLANTDSDPRHERMDWNKIESVALTVTKKSSVLKKRPGFLFYPDNLYAQKFGDFATNGKAMSEGHRPWVMDNKKGYLVPKEQITEIDFQDELAVGLESAVGSTDDMSLDALQAMQGTIASSLWNESSGGVDRATDAMLNLPLSSLQLPGSTSQTQGSVGASDLMSFTGGAPVGNDTAGGAPAGPLTDVTPRRILPSGVCGAPPTATTNDGDNNDNDNDNDNNNDDNNNDNKTTTTTTTPTTTTTTTTTQQHQQQRRRRR